MLDNALDPCPIADLGLDLHWLDPETHGLTVRELRERYSIRRANGDEIYVPEPRQALLHACIAPNVLYGGAMGGGKSHGSRWHAILACLTIPNFRALLLRRDYQDNKRTHHAALLVELPNDLAQWVGADKSFVFNNGSVFTLGGCNTDKDFQNWMSTEWDMIIMDEATTFTNFQLMRLKLRLRTSQSQNVRPQYVLASNPGSESHVWVKNRFIDKTVDRAEDPLYDPSKYCFIPSKVDDNPHVNAEYIAILDSLPEDDRRAFRDGDWGVFAGQYFKDLRRAVHSYSHSFMRENQQGWYDAFLSWDKWRSYDWGFAKPASMGWWTVDPDGNLFRYRDLYVAGMEVEEFMALAIELGAEDFSDPTHTYSYTICDPACQDATHGKSKIERAMDAGVLMTPAEQSGAKQSRVPGWSMMRKYINPKTRPMLYVSEECLSWWKTVPSLVHDERKVEDLDTKGEDHAADESRYFVMSRPSPQFVSTNPEFVNPFTPGTPEHSAQDYLLKMRQRAKVQGPPNTSRLGLHPEFGAYF